MAKNLRITSHRNPQAARRSGIFRRTVGALFPPVEEWRAAMPAFALSAVSGLLIRFAHRPFDLSPLAFLALVPLFWGLRRCKPMMAFWVALVFGSLHGYWATGWVTVVARFNPMVYAGVLPLALWWGAHLAVALAVLVYFARNLTPWKALFAGMAAWAAMEYFRMIGQIQLPFGMLAQSQAGWLSMAQLVSIGGMPLLSALIIGVNLSIMETIAAFKARYGQGGAMLRLGFMLTLVIAAHIYGARVISETYELYESEETSFPVRVALVQTNIDQEVKFASYASPDPREQLRLQNEMFSSLLAQLRSIEPREMDLIVTPESSLTHDFVDIEEQVQRDLFGNAPLLDIIDVARELETPIVVGGVDNVFGTETGDITEEFIPGYDIDLDLFRPGYHVYGALWLIRPTDEGIRTVADYRKVQLMPFGETVPYLGLIPGFQEKIVQIGSFAAGRKSPPIGMLVQRTALDETREVRLGPSICFEDLFPSIHRHFTKYGVQLYVNTTNDAWFDHSQGPAWHHEMARWRSIETRIPMVRATNTGVTSFIDATGQIAQRLPLLEQNILKLDVRVLTNPGRTIYSRIGDLFGALSLLGTIALLVYLVRRRPR